MGGGHRHQHDQDRSGAQAAEDRVGHEEKAKQREHHRDAEKSTARSAVAPALSDRLQLVGTPDRSPRYRATMKSE